jgi:AIG2 family protein
VYYFSYGSNMSTVRLLSRVPSAVKLGVAVLQKHELKFHKISDKDGSAKCDVIETGNPTHCVIGIVFTISESDKPELDRIEGWGYKEKHVIVTLNDGQTIEAFTYYATNIDSKLKPFHWYKEHVLRGARENELAEDYINKIEAIESIDDPDSVRNERELKISR